MTGKQHTSGSIVPALTKAYLIHTLAQVILGAGTPVARQGRVMGVPSIALNT